MVRPSLLRQRTRRISPLRTPQESGCPPLCAHRCMLEGAGRRVDPRAARNPLHAEETEMKMMLDFQHLRERISHLTHDAWNSIVTTTDHVRTTTLNIRRRKSGAPTSTSQDQDNRPH